MLPLNQVDISENALYDFDHEVFETLLYDRTTGGNIMWCTADYAHLGEGYAATDQITAEKITGSNGSIIRPRALKSKQQQRGRTRNKAEVFTPAWICNAQNNLIDAAWFGRGDVFNTENPDHTWTTNYERVVFPEGKTWQDYVSDTRLEITCGEAPYLASRYDATTGLLIPLADRIGLLDRKLRIVGENVTDHAQWLRWARKAYQSVYGFEWQGDNLLLARESLLLTFLEYHQAKFGRIYLLGKGSIRTIANILSWNLWQMDGLKGQCVYTQKQKFSPLMDEYNTDFCKIMDWETRKPLRFISLLNTQQNG